MRILIVDDHQLIQTALAITVQKLDASCTIASAQDLNEASQLIDAHKSFDLVLLDLGLPGATGLSALTDIRARYPELAVVVVSGKADRESVIEAINLGCMGYIPKSTPTNQIIEALKTVLEGRIYLPAEVLRPQGAAAGPSGDVDVGRLPPGGSSKPNYGLTPRELEVLKLLLRGLSNKLIARQLNKEESTVKTQVTSIIAKLGATNRTQAVIAASRLGIRIGDGD